MSTCTACNGTRVVWRKLWSHRLEKWLDEWFDVPCKNCRETRE